MKKLLAIALTLTIFVQAIPVLHFFCSQEKSSIIFSFLDEDKPDGAKSKLKKDSQEFISSISLSMESALIASYHITTNTSILPSPYLGSLTPPPDHLS